jgi:hypothetical protein
MRQLMLAPELATTLDGGVGAQAIFITPSSGERIENWRRQQLDRATADAGYPQAPRSGLDAQAQSRRGGQAEPATTPDGP